MPTTSQRLTWLITGSSSGFGLELARLLLSRGHNVIATSRNPARTPEHVKEIESSPQGKWLTLDVTSNIATIRQTVSDAAQVFGNIDVLVNNAGYSILGNAEEIPEDKAKAQFEVNFWGLVRVTQAVLPYLRAQQSGTIVNISSIGGFTALPSCAIYAASKFAVEAWSESLAQETAPFGVRVLVVEPGAFRTNFLGNTALQITPVSDPYKGGPADQMMGMFDTMDGKQMGDPVKAVTRIADNIERGLSKEDLGKPSKLHLPLGKDCYDRIMDKMQALHENWLGTKDEALGLQLDE